MAEVLPIRARAPLASNAPEAPETLSEDAGHMWRSIVEEWVLGPDALPLLALGLESWDRYRQAADILKRDGPVLETEKGVRQHPAHSVMRDNLTAVRQCFRQLNLAPPE